MEELIRKQDAIKALSEAFGECEPCDKEEAIDIAVTTVKEVPPADRPQGEWIFNHKILCSDIGVYSAGYRCSVCGKDYFKVDGMRFCPSCGARMKGTNDDL